VLIAMEFSMKNSGVFQQKPGSIFELIGGKESNQVHFI
jgi:hypothetical protein